MLYIVLNVLFALRWSINGELSSHGQTDKRKSYAINERSCELHKQRYLI